MGRTIESVHGFTHTPKFRLSKEVVAVRCEDGAVYQFEKPAGRTRWDFTKSFAPDGTMKNTGARKALAGSVEELANNLFGSEGDGWQK